MMGRTRGPKSGIKHSLLKRIPKGAIAEALRTQAGQADADDVEAAILAIAGVDGVDAPAWLTSVLEEVQP